MTKSTDDAKHEGRYTSKSWIVTRVDVPSAGDVARAIAELADAGWEVATSSPHGDGLVLWFKRPAPGNASSEEQVLPPAWTRRLVTGGS
jgi:hypothetical protein